MSDNTKAAPPDVSDEFMAALQSSFRKETAELNVSKADAEKIKTRLFSFSPPLLKCGKQQKMYTDLFGKDALPRGWRDFPMTVFTATEWAEEIRPYIPTKADYIIGHPKVLYHAARCIEDGKAVLMTGPTGSGKTELYAFICAAVGRPLVRTNGMEGLDIGDIVGQIQAANGSTYWVDGPAALAVRHGAVWLDDEPFKNNAGINMCKMPLLDGGRMLLLFGHNDAKEQMLPAHPEFRYVAADNVRGNGDGVAQYGATKVQDGALLNRVSRVLFLPYLPPAAEQKLLTEKYAGIISLPEAERMVQLGNLLRTAWDQGEVDSAFSPRTLMAWAEEYSMLGDIGEAFLIAYGVHGSEADTLRAIKQAWQAVDFDGHKLPI